MHHEIFTSFIRHSANSLTDQNFMRSFIQNCISVYGVAVGKLDWIHQAKLISRIFGIIRRNNNAENIGIKLICECLNHANLGMIDIVEEI